MKLRIQRLLTVLLGALVVSQRLAAAQLYHFTDLGVLPGQNFSIAAGINSYGDVVGSGSGTDYKSHAFVWIPGGGMQDLGQLPSGSSQSYGFGINDAMQIVGQSVNPTGIDRAFLWTSGTGMQELGDLPGDVTHTNYATAINNNGKVAGIANSNHAGFVWTSGAGMQELPNFPFRNDSGANAVGSDGRVGGYIGSVAVIWATNGTIESLVNTLLGGEFAQVTSLNSVGQAVGISGGGRNIAYQYAFSWTAAGGMKDMGTLQTQFDGPGIVLYTTAYSINNSGLAVGDSLIGSGASSENHAFLWSEGAGMEDLNNLLDGSATGWTLDTARGINDAGDIVGGARDAQGDYHAFLLTPVPEPCGYILAATGIVGLAALCCGRYY